MTPACNLILLGNFIKFVNNICKLMQRLFCGSILSACKYFGLQNCGLSYSRIYVTVNTNEWHPKLSKFGTSTKRISYSVIANSVIRKKKFVYEIQILTGALTLTLTNPIYLTYVNYGIVNSLTRPLQLLCYMHFEQVLINIC